MSPHILELLSLLLMTSTLVTSHMLLSSPPSLRYKGNPNAGSNVDYDLTSPLKSASQNPCKGYLSLIGTPEATPVDTWVPGNTYKMTISGGAQHLGGSCQAAISVDRGQTFHVIKSFIGSCPTPGAADSSFEFRLPGDTPATDVGVFAWHWSNFAGNREHYSNCAIVKIASGGGGGGKEKVRFESRPAPFIANLGNDCATAPRANVDYPDPGPDVDRNGDAVPPVGGGCGRAVQGSASGGSSGAAGSGESSGGVVAGGSPVGGVGQAAGPAGTAGGGYFSTAAPGAAPTDANLGTGGSGSGYGSGSDSGSGAGSGASSGSSGGSSNDDPTAGSWTPGNDWPVDFDSATSSVVLPSRTTLSVVAAAVLLTFAMI